MSDAAESLEKIRALAAVSGRYRPEAYLFTLAAVTYTVHKHATEGRRGHVTGQQLLDGIKELALDRFGYLARTVFEQQGLKRTDDFGEIVFELIEANILSKQPTDSKQDFCGHYDFREALETNYRA